MMPSRDSSFRGLPPRKRFTLTLLLIYAVSLPVISGISYYILRDSAVRDAYRTARLYLSTIEAARHYVGTELRPVLYEELPERFIVEGMSRSYIARKIAKKVLEELPGYRYKNASLNPRNPQSAADDFERDIIERFKESKQREWRGVRSDDGRQYYVIALPGKPVKESCLRCHGDPETAPREIVERYGTKAGFYMKVGDIVDALFVYTPINVPLKRARDTVMVFIGMYTVFFAFIFVVIDRRFRWFYQRIESDKKEIEEFNREILNLNQEMEAIVAERTTGMIGLRVADRIRNPLTIIGGLCNRLLRKELDEETREKISSILLECRKMEEMIEEFDALVKTKRFLFKRVDLNEIILSVVRPLEKEIRERGIELTLRLQDKPLLMNANRQLLKIAVGHLLSNAIDASSPGDRISIVTAAEDDRIVLEISDTGVGISEEDLPRIFNPFFSTKERIGMGLPLVKQVVDEHLGEITVESELYKGTTFRITFPRYWIGE